MKPYPSLNVTHPKPLTRAERIHLLIACLNILMCLFYSIRRSDSNRLTDKMNNFVKNVTFLIRLHLGKTKLLFRWFYKWFLNILVFICFHFFFTLATCLPNLHFTEAGLLFVFLFCFLWKIHSLIFWFLKTLIEAFAKAY